MPCSDRFTDNGEGATFCQSTWLETSPLAERLLIGCRPAPHWDVEAAIMLAPIMQGVDMHVIGKIEAAPAKPDSMIVGRGADYAGGR
jgi:hypothetical protein